MRKLLPIILIIITLSVLCVTDAVSAAGDDEGPRVTQVRGEALVYYGGGYRPMPVYRGMIIGMGDVISTGAASSVSMSYFGKDVTIGELTLISINSIWNRHNRDDSSLSLIEGTVRNRVNIELGDKSRNVIRAANTIAGVRGTEYILVYSRMGLEDYGEANPFARLTVIDGTVRFELDVENEDGSIDTLTFLIDMDGLTLITEDIDGSQNVVSEIGIGDGSSSGTTIRLDELDSQILLDLLNSPTITGQRPDLVEAIEEALEKRTEFEQEREAPPKPDPQPIYESEADAVLPSLPTPAPPTPAPAPVSTPAPTPRPTATPSPTPPTAGGTNPTPAPPAASPRPSPTPAPAPAPPDESSPAPTQPPATPTPRPNPGSTTTPTPAPTPTPSSKRNLSALVITPPTAAVYNGSAHPIVITDEGIDVTGSPDLVVAYSPGNVNAGTVTYTVSATSDGDYTGTQRSGTYTIAKATGAAMSGITIASTTHNSVTINGLSADSVTGQVPEYNISLQAAPGTYLSASWQTTTAFAGLDPSTNYLVYVRAGESANYNAGAVSAGIPVTTNAPPAAGTEGNPFLVTQANITSVGRGTSVTNEQGTYTWSLSSHYLLTETVTLSSNWTAIGAPAVANRFTGTFDGGGYEIRNLTISGVANNGMFAAVGAGGTVKNLGLANVSVNITGSWAQGIDGANSNGSNTGALAGSLAAGGTVDNCYVDGGAVSAGTSFAGGLVGYNMGTIRNSWSDVSVTGGTTSAGDCIGGIAGKSLGTVVNCYAMGAISGRGFVGGVVGSNHTVNGAINLVALNTTVTGTDVTIGRVIGGNVPPDSPAGQPPGTGDNNYARTDIGGATTLFTERTQTGKDGEDIRLANIAAVQALVDSIGAANAPDIESLPGITLLSMPLFDDEFVFELPDAMLPDEQDTGEGGDSDGGNDNDGETGGNDNDGETDGEDDGDDTDDTKPDSDEETDDD